MENKNVMKFPKPKYVKIVVKNYKAPIKPIELEVKCSMDNYEWDSWLDFDLNYRTVSQFIRLMKCNTHTYGDITYIPVYKFRHKTPSWSNIFEFQENLNSMESQQ